MSVDKRREIYQLEQRMYIEIVREMMALVDSLSFLYQYLTQLKRLPEYTVLLSGLSTVDWPDQRQASNKNSSETLDYRAFVRTRRS